MKALLQELGQGGEAATLILMPVSRILLERQLNFGRFRIFPPGSVDLTALRPIPNRTLSQEPSKSTRGTMQGQARREMSTSLTGFSAETLAAFPLVAFIAAIDWSTFLNATHQEDVEMVKLLSAQAERAFDLIRFQYCRLDSPDTLPGSVGSWSDSGPYLGAMLYFPKDHESYLIAGAAEAYTTISSGVGLDLTDACQDEAAPPSAADGEVGGVAVHALTLLSDAMSARNDTSKFASAMTLLEFLGAPFEFEKWKTLKGKIICHCARSREDYLRMAERFRELTSIQDSSGNQCGLRTRVIHHGSLLEELIPDKSARSKLFRELQMYCGCVIEDMLRYRHLTWEDFSLRRRDLMTQLGIPAGDRPLPGSLAC